MENKIESNMLKEPRLVLERDWEKLRDFRLRAVTDSPQAFGATLATVEARTEDVWRGWANDTYQFVIEKGEIFVAGVTLRKDTDGTWIINGVWTDPAFRSQGLSRSLFTAVFTQARTLGVQHIELNVNVVQTEAIALYESLGFKHIRKEPKNRWGDGNEYETVVMGMQLE